MKRVTYALKTRGKPVPIANRLRKYQMSEGIFPHAAVRLAAVGNRPARCIAEMRPWVMKYRTKRVTNLTTTERSKKPSIVQMDDRRIPNSGMA